MIIFIFRHRGRNQTLPRQIRDYKQTRVPRHHTLGSKVHTIDRPIDHLPVLQIVPSRIPEYETRSERQNDFMDLSRNYIDIDEIIDELNDAPLHRDLTVPIRMQTMMENPTRFKQKASKFHSLPAHLKSRNRVLTEHANNSLNSVFRELMEDKIRAEARKIAARIVVTDDQSSENLDDVELDLIDDSELL